MDACRGPEVARLQHSLREMSSSFAPLASRNSEFRGHFSSFFQKSALFERTQVEPGGRGHVRDGQGPDDHQGGPEQAGREFARTCHHQAHCHYHSPEDCKGAGSKCLPNCSPPLARLCTLIRPTIFWDQARGMAQSVPKSKVCGEGNQGWSTDGDHRK